MYTVKVHTDKPYDVHIERGILNRLAEYLAPYTGRRIMLVSDDVVASLHLTRVEQACNHAGFITSRFVFPAGEDYKTLSTLDRLLTALYEFDMTHTDLLISVGGGLVGDVTGLAAALYCRGTPFIQLPTSLLAAVDASVGGKTAVNLRGAKNQIGCFHQPALVLCDPDLMDTLPPSRMAEGMAEVIKYALIARPELLDMLSPVKDLCAVIAACIDIKADIVSRDEFDGGVRRLLNLGHTFGHAVECVSHHHISHGEAVAIGMCEIYRAACRQGLCHEDFGQTLYRHLQFYGLPTETDLPREALLAAMRHDKKRDSATLTLIVPTKLGECTPYTLPVDELPAFFA